MKNTIMDEIQNTLKIIQECTSKECICEKEKEETNKLLEEQYKKLEDLQYKLVSSITEKGKELNDLQM